MRKFILFIVVFPYFISSQEKSKLIFGINAGTYLGNKNTASLYAGNVTSSGVSSILNNGDFRPRIEEYFEYPFKISSFPSNIKYNPGTEIGIHIGKEKEKSKIYVDINFAELKVQDVVVLEVDNPNNQSTEPDYVPISLIGKEKRNMINIGYQKKIFQESNISLSIPIFFQLINVELKENYVIIDRPYTIDHKSTNFANPRDNPQGYGIGFGSGFVLNYFINKDVSFDLGYHGQFSQTNFSEDLKPWGMQNSIFVRLVINGTDYLKKMMN
jgi:hypothetical protein